MKYVLQIEQNLKDHTGQVNLSRFLDYTHATDFEMCRSIGLYIKREYNLSYRIVEETPAQKVVEEWIRDGFNETKV